MYLSLLSGCVALVMCIVNCCLVVLCWSCVLFTIVWLCYAGHLNVYYCQVVLRWSCDRLLLSGCVALVM